MQQTMIKKAKLYWFALRVIVIIKAEGNDQVMGERVRNEYLKRFKKE
tara:strand:- start:6724 stop:6864 length:141 start_codon:yes stop_codon:yes gene_type:complete